MVQVVEWNSRKCDYVIVFADNSGKTGFGFKELIFLVYGTHVFSV